MSIQVDPSHVKTAQTSLSVYAVQFSDYFLHFCVVILSKPTQAPVAQNNLDAELLHSVTVRLDLQFLMLEVQLSTTPRPIQHFSNQTESRDNVTRCSIIICFEHNSGQKSSLSIISSIILALF